MPPAKKKNAKKSRKGWAKPTIKKPQAKKAAAKSAEVETGAGEKRPRRTMERVIVDLCIAEGGVRGVDPVMAARAFAEDRNETEPLAWRKWLQQVRSTAIGMARKGDLLILRKGEPADPETFKGVYRLGLPVRE